MDKKLLREELYNYINELVDEMVEAEEEAEEEEEATTELAVMREELEKRIDALHGQLETIKGNDAAQSTNMRILERRVEDLADIPRIDPADVSYMKANVQAFANAVKYSTQIETLKNSVATQNALIESWKTQWGAMIAEINERLDELEVIE